MRASGRGCPRASSRISRMRIARSRRCRDWSARSWRTSCRGARCACSRAWRRRRTKRSGWRAPACCRSAGSSRRCARGGRPRTERSMPRPIRRATTTSPPLDKLVRTPEPTGALADACAGLGLLLAGRDEADAFELDRRLRAAICLEPGSTRRARLARSVRGPVCRLPRQNGILSARAGLHRGDTRGCTFGEERLPLLHRGYRSLRNSSIERPASRTRPPIV